MPGFLTERVSNRILDCFFGGVGVEPVEWLYVGLSLSRAFRDGRVSEPGARSYSRVALGNDLRMFPPARSGFKTNALAFRFADPQEDWGLIRSVFLADGEHRGDVLAMADLPSPRMILAGDSAPTIAVNALFLSHA